MEYRSATRMQTTRSISPAVVLGLGIGGFIDGIALHQIAQRHNMGSAKIPLITMEAMQQNMVWDDWFDVVTLVLTIVGVYLLLSHSSSLSLLIIACSTCALQAQVPPSATEKSSYTGLLAAAGRGDPAQVKALITKGEEPDIRDAHGRTPLHVAAYGGKHEAMRVLVAAGANPNALENDRYDIVTIASVANDVPTLKVAPALGASAKNTTSRYDGTALIAAAHLGHAEVVRILIRAGAPLDHINNLGWTALIESIVLGDGGPRHAETLKALLEAGANVNLADRNGQTPLSLARARGYEAMVKLLRQAGSR